MPTGTIDRKEVEGETTKSGAPKETFGTGTESQSEAGTKGGEISAQRSEEARKESARKAARTRAERYGEQLTVSAEENDELKGHPTGK